MRRLLIGALLGLALSAPPTQAAVSPQHLEKQATGLRARTPIPHQSSPFVYPRLTAPARHVFEKVQRHLRRRVVRRDLSDFWIERCGPIRCRALVETNDDTFGWEDCSAPHTKVTCRAVRVV